MHSSASRVHANNATEGIFQNVTTHWDTYSLTRAATCLLSAPPTVVKISLVVDDGEATRDLADR